MKTINKILVFLLVFLTGMVLGSALFLWRSKLHLEDVRVTLRNSKEKYAHFEAVLQVLGDEYVDQKKLLSGEQHMMEEALKAYVDALEDPFTSYMNIQENSDLELELKGEADIEGIGIVVSKKGDVLQVEEVIKGGPAYKVGILPLDQIWMIGTGDVKDETVNEAVARIKGPAGTEVNLLIVREGKDGSFQHLEKTLIRERVIVPSVESDILSVGNKKLGYIEISMIGEESEKLLKQELKKREDEQLDGIILDLRGNGGGLLEIAVEMLGHFLPKGETAVTTKYHLYEDMIYPSNGKGERGDIPMTVLVDEATASASEIMALALREQIGATLVGSPTFGKGSIQTLANFPDGSSLKYTIGKRYSPSGINIDTIGIAPDIHVAFDTTGWKQNHIDNQLEKAKELFTNGR